MKKIGLIGGVTWVSTIEYYRLINQKVNARLGGLHSAEILINSIDLQDLFPFLKANDWERAGNLITEKAQTLKNGGVDLIAICSNTVSKANKLVAKKTGLPVIDIYESTALEIKKQNFKKVALIGTAFTMEDPFFRATFHENGVNAIVPNAKEQQIIHRIIMEELTKEVLKDGSRNVYLEIMNRMQKEEKIEAVILGCTEIPLLLKQKHTDIPLFDTTDIHTNYIVDYALKEED